MHDNRHFEPGIYAVVWEQNSKLAKDENHSLGNGLFPENSRLLDSYQFTHYGNPYMDQQTENKKVQKESTGIGLKHIQYK